MDRSISCCPCTFQVTFQTFRILQQMAWIEDNTPQRAAIWMVSVVVDVNDKFVANLFGVVAITDKFELKYDLMFGKEKIHASVGTGVARCELLRPDIGNPRSQERVEEILDIIFGGEG